MDLQTFVSESLTQIAQGVADAQETVSKCGGIINPYNIGSTSPDEKNLRVKDDSGNYLSVRRVLFDVAVTTTSEHSASGGAKINVMSLHLNGDGKKTKSNESVSKINFAVNMALPAFNAAPNSPSPKEHQEKAKQQPKKSRLK